MIMYPESVKKAFLIGIAALFLVVPVSATPIDPVDLQVVDADTIQTYRQRPNVRLVGFNAPETRNAACQAEADLGAKATQRLRELVKLGNLDFAYVRCSCPDTTRSCNWGRDCGILKSNGRDVGATLIAEGLAVPFVCSATRCPPTPRPWCDPVQILR